MPEWVFERLQSASVRRDPNETLLFRTEHADDGEYAGTDALVREILQNSMDAKIGEEPVRVRLALYPRGEMPPAERLALYFSRLEAPLKQREIVADADGIPNLSEGFLVCEDFGTRGLEGNPQLVRDPVPGSSERQDFFWFWRNIGRSGKTGDDLGRWGLGKTVYRAVSEVGCMLGMTIRASDRRCLLMGQAVLKIHEHDGVEHVPEGFWCDGRNNEGVPRPIERPDELDRFRAEWKLARKDDEPGLSVVVPFVAAELKGFRMLQAICVHFFVPILEGRLVVDLYSPETREVHLDAKSLPGWCGSITWDGPKRTKRHASPPLDFVSRCLAEVGQAVPTEVLGQKTLPELTEAAIDSGTLDKLRKKFADERLVAMRVRLALPRKKGADEIGEFVAFLQRRQDAGRHDTYFVREGMTITKINSSAGAHGIQAFVLVDRGPLASLLGDSEGPDHEDWDTSQERPNKQWVKWKGRVKFCRGIVDKLVLLLAPPVTKANFELLSDFFSIERAKAPQRSRAPAKNGEGKPTFAEIVAKPRWYRVQPRTGGFRLTGNPPGPDGTPYRLRLSLAYDLPSGNPLKKWSPLDFDIDPKKGSGPTPKGENVALKRLAGNILELTVKGPSFTFGMDGFDEHRDLLVRVDEIDEDKSSTVADEGGEA
jgi:hypothetical protein